MKENQEKKQREIVGQKAAGSEMLNNDKITISLVIASIIWNCYTSYIHGYPGWFTFILNVMLYYLAPMMLFGAYSLILNLRGLGELNDKKTPHTI